MITGDSKCRALEPTDVALTRKNIDVYSKAEVDLKKGMKFTRVNAPSGAEEGKFYPVVIKRSATSNGELASRVIISTAPRQAAHRMNNCEFNGFVMPAGWSDRGRYAYGMFWQYQDAERAIHSIAMSNKDDEVSSVFYIEGGAFPVCVLVEEGLSVVVPTTDYIVGQTTYKWGATNPKAECIAADIIIDFSNGRGFYSSGNLNGNAATATKLQTARTINGVTFDGTTDISLTPENIGALSLSGGTLLGGLTAPLLTTKSDLIFSSHTSRHIRFTYTKNDGTTLTDGYIFKDGVDNPNRRPGIRINCAAPNKETGNGTNSGDWIFGEDGIFTMPGGTVLRGGINSNGVPQSEYKHDMLTSVVDDAKMYLRRFRSSTGASIWHETIENNVYRLCTGTTDAQEELVLRTGSYAKFAGEIISKSANGLRIAYGNYGFFIRNDGSSTYFMLTASGDNLGTWNSLRPLTINNANGAVSIGNGLNVTGDIRTNAWVYANRFSVNSSSGSWISMRDQNVIFGLNKVSTSSAQALLRQDHADRKFFIGGLGNSQFGFYMINNSRTSNGTDGQAFLDSSGNFQCGGQILPANYSNFDSRYTLKTACVTSVRMGSAASYKPSSNGVSWTQNLGSGLVMTGIIVQETGSNSADNIGGIYYRPVQYCINGTWYTAASV
ncbi:phage tail protein [Escherichia coli]|uniref:phage tail fiber protein n=1 Tax=Escherichia coli TaxID=562 RepID=UPI003D6637A4